jgi:DNA-binding NarL/FixJ family response regulator
MHGASRPRIVIADDHTLIAEAFDKLLENEFEVVARVQDGHSLIEAARKLHPDVVLVDIGMPLLNGLEAAQRIKRTQPDIKIIYVTINRDADVVAEAFRGGASVTSPPRSSP